jgi:hypothetical protein
MEKVKQEIRKLSDLNYVKGEIRKIANEVRGLDLQTKLSPSAQRRLKDLETRYAVWLQSVSKAQKQLDREFNRALRTLKKTKTDVLKNIDTAKKTASAQQKKISTASAKLKANLKKKVTKKTAKKTTKKSARAAGTTKKTTKKA